MGIIDSTITGLRNVGSLVGKMDNSTVLNCYTNATVNGKGDTGGFVGFGNKSNINNCYAMATVTTTGATGGGVVGYLAGTINNVYSIATVSAKSYPGAIVGFAEPDHSLITLTNVYIENGQNANGNHANISFDGVTKLDVAQMNDGTLTQLLNANVVDGYEAWGTDANGYPCFVYQVDTLALEEAIEQAEQIDTTIYTTETLKHY